MQPAWNRFLRALFVGYVAATAVHIGFVMAHEPFSFDAWNIAVDTGAKPFSLGRFFDVLAVRVHALESAPRPAADVPGLQARRRSR